MFNVCIERAEIESEWTARKRERGTAPLKPKPGLSGPPASRGNRSSVNLISTDNEAGLTQASS